MSKDSVADWDATAANNTDIGGIGIANSSSIRLGNDAMQEMMAQLASAQIVGGSSGAAAVAAFGQCRLTLDTGSLKLIPFNGNLLTIDGAARAVPSAGVTLAATGLTPSTLYRIYAYMDSGTMTLEASTTARATDSTTGVEIKSGDATRTLVGMAYCVTGPAWADTDAQRLVASWFNRRRRVAFKKHGGARSIASGSGTFAELSTSDRVEFVSWAAEVVASYTGSASSDTAARGLLTGLGVDGSAPTQFTTEAYVETANQLTTVTAVYPASGLSEGYHYVSPYGARSGDGTRTWSAAGGTSIALEI